MINLKNRKTRREFAKNISNQNMTMGFQCSQIVDEIPPPNKFPHFISLITTTNRDVIHVISFAAEVFCYWKGEIHSDGTITVQIKNPVFSHNFRSVGPKS